MKEIMKKIVFLVKNMKNKVKNNQNKLISVLNVKIFKSVRSPCSPIYRFYHPSICRFKLYLKLKIKIGKN